MQSSKEKLKALSQEYFEETAKRVATRFSEHDVQTTEYRSLQKYSGGELLWLLSQGVRSQAKEILLKVVAHFGTELTDFCEDDDFADYVFAYLLHGELIEVEWNS